MPKRLSWVADLDAAIVAEAAHAVRTSGTAATLAGALEDLARQHGLRGLMATGHRERRAEGVGERRRWGAVRSG